MKLKEVFGLHIGGVFAVDSPDGSENPFCTMKRSGIVKRLQRTAGGKVH